MPSTAPLVVVSDMATRGRSGDARSTGNVLAKQSWVMIGTHSSECWIQDQCKHSATAHLQRAGSVRYPRFFLLCFPQTLQMDTVLPGISCFGRLVSISPLIYQKEVFQLGNLRFIHVAVCLNEKSSSVERF